MRISLLGLLLLVPAWLVAFLLPQSTRQGERKLYQHEVVANEIRNIRLWAVHQSIWRPNIKYKDLDYACPWQRGSPVDAWDNFYQFVELEQPGPLNSQSTFHVYSLGKDGKSKSSGNDADDINSWDIDPGRYYKKQIQWPETKRRIFRSLWMTPFLWAVALVVLRMIRRLNSCDIPLDQPEVSR